MKVYFVSGEASGDLHAANLLKAMRRLHPSLEARALGGDRLAEAGASLVRHNRDLNHFGFVEVVRHLPQILGLFAQLEADIAVTRPDAVVLVDYPGFNLRLARTLKRMGIRVFYYISPQLWAWKEGRIKTIRECVDRLYCILPFEQSWYESRHLEVDYVGHPLLDAIAEARQRPDTLRDDLGLDARPLVALLPGSRPGEVSKMLPTMLAAARASGADAQWVIGAAPNLSDDAFAQAIAASGLKVSLVRHRTYDLMRAAQVALVTSGTATLETALWQVPQVLCYRVNTLSYWMARRLIKLRYVGLPNLILDRPVIRELLQDELTVANLSAELHRLLSDTAYRARMQADYGELRHALGDEGASERTARLMLSRLGA